MSRRILVGLLSLAVLVIVLLGPYAARKAAPRNLLLITIDTLRADRLGSYGYSAGVTPALDALAGRGTRFERCQTPVPLTGPSHATILTGLYPPVHGLRDNERLALAADTPTLAERLRAAGYRTAAFVSGYPLTSGFGFAQGFEHFDESFRRGGATERDATAVAAAAIAWLSSAAAEPFFAWVHFWDPHAPYSAPEPFRGRFADPYDAEVAYTDAQLGRLAEALEAAALTPRTVVAVVSDHGEGLGDHGEATHGILIYESTLRVPLILAGPGVPAGRVVAVPVGTIDLLPTLLSLLAQAVPPELPGRSLRPALEGGSLPPASLYAESLLGRLACRWSALRGWSEGHVKLIDGVEPELYDLASDPSESRNRATAEPQTVERMRRRLRVALAQMTPAGDRLRRAPAESEQQEALRALGYISGSGGGGTLDEPGLPDPRSHVALYERLQDLVGLADSELDAGLTQAQEVVARDPGNPAAHVTLGLLAERSGRVQLAVRAYAQAVRLDRRPTLLEYYGRALRAQGELAAAEDVLRQAVSEGGPYASRVRVTLLDTLLVAGKTAEARALAREILAREPDNPFAKQALTDLLSGRFRR